MANGMRYEVMVLGVYGIGYGIGYIVRLIW